MCYTEIYYSKNRSTKRVRQTSKSRDLPIGPARRANALVLCRRAINKLWEVGMAIRRASHLELRARNCIGKWVDLAAHPRVRHARTIDASHFFKFEPLSIFGTISKLVDHTFDLKIILFLKYLYSTIFIRGNKD